MQPKAHAGFTLIELVIVIVVLGIISVYAVVRSVSPAEITLPSQAQTLASDIRRAQTLAYTGGKHLRFTGGNTYKLESCVVDVNGVVTSCPTIVFSVPLQKGVTMTLGGTSPLDFNTLGQPSGAASYKLNNEITVTVAALTGFVTVSP